MPKFTVDEFKEAADKICNEKPYRLLRHEVKDYWLTLYFKSNSGKKTWSVSIYYSEDTDEWVKTLSYDTPKVQIIFNEIMSLLEK